MPSLNDVLTDLREVRPAMADILKERVRQITEEGFGPGHDDAWGVNQLALAASAYAAWPNPAFTFGPEHDPDLGKVHFEDIFPFLPKWDKRGDVGRRRLLVMAGALIVAEIERLDRKGNLAFEATLIEKYLDDLNGRKGFTLTPEIRRWIRREWWEIAEATLLQGGDDE